ncbi:hypothetical protein GCM10011506_30030 [Marivirga lumbricoides]|uniref:Peptidoglycan binding-like domain-containing protein n=1 Tax=Marivirga lumbricoides TaxID=1046115 RepID=A0ABQ1MLT8_9BACT|nr:hypothetical protein GCM10011506_30030 [Marivirga lumbricoides]
MGTTKSTQKRSNGAQKSSLRKTSPGINRRYIIYGLGAGAVLGGGYFLYNYLQDRQLMQRSEGLIVNNILPSLPASVARLSSGSFPLKSGSKGTLVKQLQQALLNIGGETAQHIRSTSVRPDETPDGVFGSGTEKALRAAGYNSVVSESTFAQIIGSSKSNGALNGKTIADQLIKAANEQNLFAALAALKQMQNTNDYQSVKSHFATARVGGVRVTSPVNALLSVAFKNNEAAKVKIRAEFSRMGLKQSANGTWTLSGLNGLGSMKALQNYLKSSESFSIAITRKPTMLRNGQGDYMVPAIPAQTVLGYLTNDKKGVAQIITENGVTVYAPSQNLKLI